MNKYLFGLFAILVCCNCSSNRLANSVWYNVTPGEVNGVEGNIFTTIYFYEDKQMCINTAVEQNKEMLIPPTITSYGTYSYKGNIKKGIDLTITEATNIGNDKIRHGVITTDGLFLIENDSVARVYTKASNLTLKRE
ncbi:MAG: hypothetical protein Q4F45_07885 [Alistipes sp.]|nr:hypothetical protein [Alistipes sp.]